MMSATVSASAKGNVQGIWNAIANVSARGNASVSENVGAATEVKTAERIRTELKRSRGVESENAAGKSALPSVSESAANQ